ncbi:MAG TPA: condensation domain-containing protein, partial [Longimicrobium sp.]
VDLTITNLLPLFAGRPVHMLPEENAVEALADAIRARPGYGAVKITPIHLTLLTPLLTVDEARSAAHTLVIGADFLPAESTVWWQDNAPGVRLMNEYGPTETVVGCSAYTLPHGRHRSGAVPVGGPIRNLTFHVLDAHLEPVPVGIPGELYIGGAGVARGYLGRPSLSAEKFVPDPFAGAGARMYRTGDRARWQPDGNLLILGRTDNQVKLRGYRVELGEIEGVLRRHEGVTGCLVVVREDVPGDRRLVAYVAGTAGTAELREYLRGSLPEYMVPGAFVRLESMPQTATGKIDPRTLPAPQLEDAGADYVAPRTAVEELLAAAWSEVLGVPRVGTDDNFFDLGGHSLLAMRVISRIRETLGVELPLRVLFEGPTVARLAERVEMLRRDGAVQLAPVVPADRTGPLPLSFAQQRLWFLEQMGGLGSTYHVAQRLRLRGTLDRGALVRALDGLVARHEALRTTFAEANGAPEQRIAPATTGFALVEQDLAGQADALERVIAEEAAAPFHLEHGPLIRGRLVRLAADDHVLLLTLHHIVADDWSMDVLVDELGRLYAAFQAGEADPLPALPVQYADYAAWQRRWVRDEVLEQQAGYWTRTLAGAPALLELPTDHPRPQRQDHAGAYVGLELDEALTAGLKELGRRHGATPFMTLLAGWATLLARLSGQDEVVVGTPSANRGRAEIEGLIGFFVNTLALRVDLSARPTVAQLLEQVKARALEAQQNQDIPFEQVVERVQPVRSMAHTPLFQAVFAWQNASGGSLALPGLELAPVAGAERRTAKFDLSLSMAEWDGRMVGAVEYATSLFERATVERYVGYLRRVLREMVADDARTVDGLALLPAAERRRVV